MAALLVVAAVLQYLWTAEVSTASEARIGNDLESLMIRWHLDLYREFSAICVALQVGPDSGARDAWDDYLQRYTEWSRAEVRPNSSENIYRNPDFVADLFVWETSRGAGARLLRFNRDSDSIELSAPPSNLSTLLARLQSRSSSLSVALHAWELEDDNARTGSGSSTEIDRNNETTGWQFDQSVPAIVHPIVHRTTDAQGSRRKEIEREIPVDWIVLVLNSNTIERRILPTLADEYFGSASGPTYDVAVVSGEPARRVLYSSDKDFSTRNITNPDSVMEIFGPAPETVEAHAWQSQKNSRLIAGANWHRFASPVWFPVIQYLGEQDPWLLLVQRRNGSLAAVVAKVREKNLAIGSVVLLLLAANMMLVVLMSHRTQKLGQLQMTFVASVTHELRTPLAGILSACENITAGFVRDQASLKTHASIIIGQTRQLIGLVDQILLFASTSTGKHRYVSRRFPVARFIEQVLTGLASQIQDSNFSVDVNIEEDLPEVWGDFAALCQCLQNIVANALKYSGKSRWIGLVASLVRDEGGACEIQISVEDRGAGINPSEISEIFNPFYRAQAAIAGQIPGTGLGLSVAKRIAEGAGGSISVNSTLGGGSVFTLHLPVVTEKELEKKSTPTPNVSTGA